MGYFLTTEPENAVPPKSWGRPKTHVPGPPVKERGYRYYVPEIGRWVNPDPANEVDGANIYTYVHNNCVGLSDFLGLWNTDLHKGLTATWAFAYFNSVASADIGTYDDKVDSDFSPLSPMQSDQQYHFNTSYGSASDSRNVISTLHLQKAKDFCDKTLGNDNYAESVKNFGYSIHPIQDITAHGDYPGWTGLFPHVHNLFGPPLTGASGSPRDYPDDFGLDAAGGTGAPVGSSVRNTNKAVYSFGAKRLIKTTADTHAMLSAFKAFIAATGSCDCKAKYLVTP